MQLREERTLGGFLGGFGRIADNAHVGHVAGDGRPAPRGQLLVLVLVLVLVLLLLLLMIIEMMEVLLLWLSCARERPDEPARRANAHDLLDDREDVNPHRLREGLRGDAREIAPRSRRDRAEIAPRSRRDRHDGGAVSPGAQIRSAAGRGRPRRRARTPRQ